MYEEVSASPLSSHVNKVKLLTKMGFEFILASV